MSDALAAALVADGAAASDGSGSDGDDTLSATTGGGGGAAAAGARTTMVPLDDGDDDALGGGGVGAAAGAAGGGGDDGLSRRPPAPPRSASSPSSFSSSSSPWLSRPMTAVYVSHALSSWGDRCWEFGSAVLFTYAFAAQRTLLPTALYALTGQAAAVAFGAHLGRWLDAAPRFAAVRQALFVQNACVALAGALQAVLFARFAPQGVATPAESAAAAPPPPPGGGGGGGGGGGTNHVVEAAANAEPMPWGDAGFWLPFILMNVCGGVARLASIATDVSVTKDWVVVITAANAPDGVTPDKAELAGVNAWMRRINLSCKVLAPVFVSLVILMSPFGAVVFLSVWNVLSLGPEYFLLRRVYHMHKDVLDAPKGQQPQQQQPPDKAQDEQEEDSAHSSDDGLAPPPPTNVVKLDKHAAPWTVLHQGWQTYRRQSIFIVSLAYVCLYCTALSPGALLNGFLKIYGVPIVVVGIFQGVGAVFGLAATFVAPTMIAKRGLMTTGLYSALGMLAIVVFSLISLIVAVSAVGGAATAALYIFLLSMVASRVFLWTYDLVEVQLLQENIPEEERGVVNSVERSLTNLATMAMFVFGAIFGRADQYIILAIISAGFILLSAILYGIFWNSKRHIMG